MKSKLKEFFEQLKKTIEKQEMKILPGQLAFFFVLSMIPLIAMVGSFASLFNISTNSVMSLLYATFPNSVVSIFEPIIMGKSLTSTMVIFYISAFILASNGTHSMIISSNTIYHFKNKEYLSRRIKAILMTFILVLLLLFVLLVPAFGDKIIKAIATFLKNDHLSTNIKILYNLLKYPVSILLIYFNIKLLYTMAPDGEVKSKETTYGSILTTLGWIISTEVYSFYVDAFAKYNLFYGSIANILILMLWIYILAYIFVLGMAFNSSYYQTSHEEK